MNKLTGCIVLSLLGASLAAQRTFVVDPANGPGTNFTSLAAALAQAQHDDVYLLRAGTHDAVTTDKGVRLLGVAGGVVLSGLQVANLPAGRSFALGNAAILLIGSIPPGVTVTGCAGNVYLTGLTATASVPPPPSPLPAVSLQNASSVTMRSCAFNLPGFCSGTTVKDSVLVAVDCSMIGCLSLIGPGFVSASPGLTIGGAAAHVQVCGGSYSAGNIGSYTGLVQPGIKVDGGALLLRVTDQPTILTAGSSTFSGGSALQVAATAYAWIDPAVTLVPSKSATPVQGPFSTTPLPGLATSGGGLGGPLQATLRSPSGGAYGMFLGLAQVPVGHPFGDLFLDPATIVAFASGIQGPTGLFVASLTVPTDPALRGLPIVFQTLGQTTPSAFVLTNPSVVILGGW